MPFFLARSILAICLSSGTGSFWFFSQFGQKGYFEQGSIPFFCTKFIPAKHHQTIKIMKPELWRTAEIFVSTSLSKLSCWRLYWMSFAGDRADSGSYPQKQIISFKVLQGWATNRSANCWRVQKRGWWGAQMWQCVTSWLGRSFPNSSIEQVNSTHFYWENLLGAWWSRVQGFQEWTVLKVGGSGPSLHDSRTGVNSFKLVRKRMNLALNRSTPLLIHPTFMSCRATPSMGTTSPRLSRQTTNVFLIETTPSGEWKRCCSLSPGISQDLQKSCTSATRKTKFMWQVHPVYHTWKYLSNHI